MLEWRGVVAAVGGGCLRWADRGRAGLPVGVFGGFRGPAHQPFFFSSLLGFLSKEGDRQLLLAPCHK